MTVDVAGSNTLLGRVAKPENGNPVPSNHVGVGNSDPLPIVKIVSLITRRDFKALDGTIIISAAFAVCLEVRAAFRPESSDSLERLSFFSSYCYATANVASVPS